MFRNLTPLVCLVLFPPAIAGLRAQELPDNPVCEHLKRVTVTVQTPTGSGSGCIVVRGNRAYVLTAAHVVEDLRKTREVMGKEQVTWEDCKVIQKVVQEGRTVSEVSYDAEVLRYSDADRGLDLALLRLHQHDSFKDSMKFYLGKKIPPVGTKLLHAGSPLGDIGAGSIIPGFMSAHGRRLLGSYFDQISCNAFPGSSGGAVCLEDGRWIGMVLRGKEGGFILCRPVRLVREWTDKEGILFVLDPEQKIPPEEDIKKKPDPKK